MTTSAIARARCAIKRKMPLVVVAIVVVRALVVCWLAAHSPHFNDDDDFDCARARRVSHCASRSLRRRRRRRCRRRCFADAACGNNVKFAHFTRVFTPSRRMARASARSPAHLLAHPLATDGAATKQRTFLPPSKRRARTSRTDSANVRRRKMLQKSPTTLFIILAIAIFEFLLALRSQTDASRDAKMRSLSLLRERVTITTHNGGNIRRRRPRKLTLVVSFCALAAAAAAVATAATKVEVRRV